MSFLDKLLGRDKTAAADTDPTSRSRFRWSRDNGSVAFPMHDGQQDAKKGMPPTAPPSRDIDPQFIKDTERKANQ